MGQLLISPILDLAECNIYGVDVVESFSGPKKGVEWLRFFASTRVLFFMSTNFWSADYIASILLKTATTYAMASQHYYHRQVI